MKLLKEFKEFEYEVLTEASSEGRPSRLFVKGIVQAADTLNQNGRIYPKPILFREVENYKKVVLERRATGELDHCLLGSTEVLTEDGWKRLDGVGPSEKVYTLNTDTNEIQLQTIRRTVKIPYVGKMLRFRNGKKFDVTMTPEHRVLLHSRSGKGFYVTARELKMGLERKDSRIAHSSVRSTGDWDGRSPETYAIPGTDFTIPIKAFAGMFGLWLAEGYADRPSQESGKHKSYRVGITQKKPENIVPIRQLLSETTLPWRERTRRDGTVDWVICNKALHSFFVSFGKAHEKFIPIEMLEWSKDILGEMHKWMLLGDGRNRTSSATGRNLLEYSTVSRKLAENVAEMQFKLGYRPFIRELRNPPDSRIAGRRIDGQKCKTLYTVSANVSKTYMDPRFVSVEEVEHDGFVYCLTTPNSNFLIRSNGYVCWTGNCDEPVVNLKNVSHLFTDIWTEGNLVYGKIEILPTPMGNIARALIESGVKIGISSRALGSVRNRGDADIVEDDLHLVCWDLVSEPSTHGAFMMKEAKDIDPKILNQIFTKSDRIDRVANEILGIKKVKL